MNTGRPLRAPTAEASAKQVIRKSIFISSVFPVDDTGKVREMVQAVRARHPKARHVVWAYAVESGGRQSFGMSDDGEPRGTAGKPTLNLIQKEGLTNILVTVARYFGGIKLGTGGLVRAYSECVRAALDEVPCTPLIPRVEVRLRFSYDLLDTLRAALDEMEIEIPETTFASDVTMTCHVPTARMHRFRAALDVISPGRIRVTGPE
jgi:uncharacterized YigZ family protein